MSVEAREAIKAILAQYAERRKAGDVEGMVDLFTANASVMVPGAPIFTGREALLAAYEFYRSTPGLECAYEVDEVVSDGDVVSARTHSSGTYYNQDEQAALPAEWREIFVCQRQDARWRIALYMFQSGP